jgi:hypothetical protein
VEVGRPGAPSVGYSEFALPNPECTFTTPGDGAWVMVNAPVNVSDGAKTHSYRLRMKGRMRESDREPVLLGEREVELFAGAITAVGELRLQLP